MVGYDVHPYIGQKVRLVGPDPLLALRGPLTSATGCLNLQVLPAKEGSRGLRRQLRAVEQVDAQRTVGAAGGAGWRVPATLGEQRVRHRLERLDLADDAVAAVVRAGATAAPADRVAHDAQRELELERLDRRVQRVRHRHVHAA